MAAASQPSVIVEFTMAECRAERLVQIRDAFLSGCLYTVEELAEHYGVSRYTIYRDIRSISRKLRVPLVCETRWGLMRK